AGAPGELARFRPAREAHGAAADTARLVQPDAARAGDLGDLVRGLRAAAPVPAARRGREPRAPEGAVPRPGREPGAGRAGADLRRAAGADRLPPERGLRVPGPGRGPDALALPGDRAAAARPVVPAPRGAGAGRRDRRDAAGLDRRAGARPPHGPPQHAAAPAAWGLRTVRSQRADQQMADEGRRRP